jgi:quercetin dioxygenase-like cupin family protein
MSTTRASTVLVPNGAGESAHIPGIKVVFKVTKHVSGGAYSMCTNRAEPGAGVPMHTHRTDDETIVVLRGRIVCRVGDDTFGAGPGDTIHMPAGEPHGWRVDGEEPVDLLVVFSLTPNSDYEEMFRRLATIEPDDFEKGSRFIAANGLELVMPPAFV